MGDFMKGKWKKLVAFFCVGVMVFTLPIKAAASAPTEAYTHQESVSGEVSTVYGRDVYMATKQINATTLGTEKLSGITDMCCSADGKVYVLCGDESRILILDSNYQLQGEMEIFYPTGKNCDFSGAMSIYVNDEGIVYIADTFSSRVLVVNTDGVVQKEIEVPVTDIIPEDFYFQPSGVLEDEEGYLYVSSLGCYYGIFLYSSELEFLGFYGANTVQSTVLDTLAYLWDLLTSNDEKKSKQVKTLPYTIVDMTMDEKGYIYTCTGVTDVNAVQTGQIRKISPGGSNILYRRNSDGTANGSASYNFLENKVISRLGSPRAQDVVALTVGDTGYMYALDKTYGKVYVYDEDCNLVTAFGGGVGNGKQLGTFVEPVALAVNGTDLLVADMTTCSLTLFELTDFGKTMFEAQELYFDGRYTEARPLWEEVLKQDGNNQFAYRGLAKACFAEGDMKSAKTYAELGHEYAIYDSIHQEEITNFIKSHFALLFFVGLLVIAGIVVMLLVIQKRKEAFIKNEKLQCFASVMFHPFVAFYDVKYRKRGSLKIAIGITALLFLSKVMFVTRSGFLFNTCDAYHYNVLFTLVETVGVLLLWTLVNWAICTVMSGKGRMKDIYIVSSYATMPLILSNALSLVLSHVMTLEGADVLNVLRIIALIYAFLLLVIGIMAIHEYDFKKFMFTSFVTLFGMILVVFVGFMIVILLQQFGNFLYSLYMEVVYR